MTASPGRAWTAALLLCGLLVVAGLGSGLVAASDQVVGHPTLDLHVRDDEVTAGQQTTLNLYVSNAGQIDVAGPSSYESRVTTARATVLTLESGDTPIEVQNGEYPVGEIPTGTHGPYGFTITIPENVSPGTYQLPVRVTYAYTHLVDYGSSTSNPDYSDSTYNQVQTVTIHVKDEPRFSVERHRADVQVGQQGTYALKLSNTGDQVARDATVTVTSSSEAVRFGTGGAGGAAQAAGGSGSMETAVGTWRPGERKTVTGPVTVSSDATVGNYSVSVSVAYTDPDGIRQTSDTLHTSLRPTAKETFALRNVSASLSVGREGTVSGRVENTGPTVAHDPVLVLPAPGSSFVVTGPERALPDLAPGESAPVSFSVTVKDGADPGPIQLSPTVRFTDGAGNQYRSDPLLTSVQVDPHRDAFALQPQTASVQAGSEDSPYTIEVTNAGSEPVRNVRATLRFPTDQQSAGASLFGGASGAPVSVADGTTYLGNLAPGESRAMNVSFNASASALAKDYPATVTFQYEKPDGTAATSKGYTVPISVVAAEGGGQHVPFTLLGGAAILVGGLGVGAYLWRRRGPGDEPTG